MRTMRTPYIVGAALALVAIVAPAAWYFTARPNEDQLNNDLRSLGYLPITPPSNLLNLGSLYYVNSDVKFFKTICSVKNDDLKDAVVESPSTSTLADELHAGQYSIGVKLDSGTAGSGHGDVGDKYVTKIYYSLSDVHLYEIALGTNHRIYSQLMAQEDCNDAVVEYLNAGGYVCQGQQILEATVEYDLRLEDARTVGAGGEIGPTAVAKAIKVATHTNSNAQVDEQSGRLVTGSALKYGIAMNPTCLTPLTGHFQRVLPRNGFDQFINFIKFRLVEPILPGT